MGGGAGGEEEIEIIKQKILEIEPLSGCHLGLVSLSSEKGPCEAKIQTSENAC